MKQDYSNRPSMIMLLILAWSSSVLAANSSVAPTENSSVPHTEHSSMVANQDHTHMKQADLGISVMLLGSVSFMMAVFYLVNHSDADVRRYSWKVLSTTISIFSAVLLFQACDGVVEYYLFTEDTPISFELAVDMIHALCWFMILTVVLSFMSGVLVDRLIVGDDVSDRVSKFDYLEINMRTVGVLLGHITGFATINAWGTLQRVAVYKLAGQDPFMRQAIGCSSLILATGFLRAVLKITAALRLKAAVADDGEVDAFEAYGHEYTQEIENDVFALTISFLVCELARFFISGELPTQEQEEELKDVSHPPQQVLLLVLAALFFGVCVFAHIKRRFHVRTHSCFKIVWAMSFAWCLYYALQWWIFSQCKSKAATRSVIAALLATAVAFGCMRILDYIADWHAPGSTVDQGVRAIIESLGILVGFSWEKSFDVAVGSVASGATDLLPGFAPEPVVKLLLALCLCLIVIPAWRWYILPIEILLEEDGRETALEVERSISGLPLSIPLLDEEALASDLQMIFSPMNRNDLRTERVHLCAKDERKQMLKMLRCEAKEARLTKQYDELKGMKTMLSKKLKKERSSLASLQIEIPVGPSLSGACTEKPDEGKPKPMSLFARGQAVSLIQTCGFSALVPTPKSESGSGGDMRSMCQTCGFAALLPTPTSAAGLQANQQSLCETCGFAALLPTPTNSIRASADPLDLFDRVESLTTEVDMVRSLLFKKEHSVADTKDTDTKDVTDLLARTGAKATELSTELAVVRRDLQDKADNLCELERDVALLQVGLSEAYHHFWRLQSQRPGRAVYWSRQRPAEYPKSPAPMEVPQRKSPTEGQLVF